ATAADTQVDVNGWDLTKLTITAPNDTNFTLSALVAAQDSNGFTYDVQVAQTVNVVDPLAPGVSWGGGGAVVGTEGTAIPLDTLSYQINSLTGQDGDGLNTNSLKSLTISGATDGTVITDGNADHSYTFSGTSDSVDVKGWSLSSLTVTPPN